ncbi:porin [Paraburkholderia phosphatilytica]|uniref:porin n=1 Tax=Paraburkholderia phosphatilytica TaxID=2282883 RepID=UPI000E547AD1|nr:porin [Paraburkholderia phosphatilytica]
MRNSLLAVSLFAASAGAYAQSSVTLYGRIDAGLEYMSGVPTGVGANGQATGSTHSFRAESGDWGTSLWGLKGSEDLGGGNHAVFHLEGAFNTMNGSLGASNTLFDRYATVGISNDQYGTLLLGKELFISNGVWDFDPFGQSNWSSASLVRGRNWLHSSNNISYQSPTIHGFDVQGQYALSNATSWNGNGTTPQGRWDGIQVTYTSQLFQVRGIYDEMRNAQNGTLDDAFTASREYTAAVNVFIGQFKLQGVYQAIRTSGETAAALGSPTTLDHEWGGITWQPTTAASLIAAVYHVNGNNGAGNATIYTVGGSYNLTKRTLFDLQIATVQNSKAANFGLNANDEGDTTATGNPFPGHSQTGVYAGIQHLF